MAHRNVETILGRLVTDAEVRLRFEADPVRAIQAFVGLGYELTATECEALAATSADALRAFAEALDLRLRKAHHPRGAETPLHRERHS